MSIDEVAEAVRTACLRAAEAAYEDAGVQGLCAEGRWEAAIGAIRRLDLATVAREAKQRAETPSSRRDGWRT